jgi:WD40 repeat protein
VATGKEVWTLPPLPGTLGVLLFSPDSKLLAGRGGDQAVRLWEVSTGEELRRIRRRPGDPGGFGNTHVSGAGLAFLPDGRTLVSGSADTTLLVWDVTRMRPVARP